MSRLVSFLAAALLWAAPVCAQFPARCAHPEVHPDRAVSFRLRAPSATNVDLVGEVLQDKGPQPMTRDADGIWSLTIGPLPPEIWIYNLRVQGVDLLRREYHPGDHVHPNDAGNAAMAAAIDAATFR